MTTSASHSSHRSRSIVLIAFAVYLALLTAYRPDSHAHRPGGRTSGQRARDVDDLAPDPQPPSDDEVDGLGRVIFDVDRAGVDGAGFRPSSMRSTLRAPSSESMLSPERGTR